MPLLCGLFSVGFAIDAIESVQKRFLLFALRNLGQDPIVSFASFENRLLLLVILSLKKRRLIDSPALLGRINYDAPQGFSTNLIFIKLDQCGCSYENLCKNLKVMYNLMSILDSLKNTKLVLLNMRNLSMSYLNKIN